jgi:DNA-binding transcriptional ArsR family regulator
MLDPVAMDATYKLHADLLKVMASPRRLEILHLLGTGPRDIASLASGIATTEPNVSQDLTVLCAAGIVEEQLVGRSVRYGLCDPEITVACDLMRDLARRRLERARVGARLNGPPDTGAARPRNAVPH